MTNRTYSTWLWRGSELGVVRKLVCWPADGPVQAVLYHYDPSDRREPRKWETSGYLEVVCGEIDARMLERGHIEDVLVGDLSDKTCTSITALAEGDVLEVRMLELSVEAFHELVERMDQNL